MEKDLPDWSGFRSLPDYRDGFLRFVGILLVAIGAIAYSGGPDESWNGLRFYLKFFAALTGIVLINEWIRFITRLLDRVYDWERRGVLRLILQIALGVICPVVVESLFATLWLLLTGRTIGEALFMQYFFFLSLLVIVLVNSYYFVRYIYTYRRTKPAVGRGAFPGHESPPEAIQGLEVYSGGEIRHYLNTDILYVYRHESYNYVRTAKDAVTHMISKPLGDIEEELGNDMFFRLNRQLIASRACIQGCTPIQYGKIKVSVSPPCPLGDNVVVSQRRAPAFREWWNMKPETQRNDS